MAHLVEKTLYRLGGQLPGCLSLPGDERRREVHYSRKGNSFR
jgi:hypothetical protein